MASWTHCVGAHLHSFLPLHIHVHSLAQVMLVFIWCHSYVFLVKHRNDSHQDYCKLFHNLERTHFCRFNFNHPLSYLSMLQNNAQYFPELLVHLFKSVIPLGMPSPNELACWSGFSLQNPAKYHPLFVFFSLSLQLALPRALVCACTGLLRFN